MSLDFVGQMKVSDDVEFQETFGKFVRTIGELAHTGSIEKQFGTSDVYDNAQINSANSSRPRDLDKRGK